MGLAVKAVPPVVVDEGSGDLEDEEERMAFDVVEDGRIILAVGLPLGQHKVQAPADREMGDEDVQDRDEPDRHPATDLRNLPNRVIHRALADDREELPAAWTTGVRIRCLRGVT